MTRTIDWPGELREAMARRGNNVRLVADDLLAWEAIPHLLTRIATLTEALRELANGGVDDIDPRISWVNLQVERGDLAAARKLLETT